MDIINSHITNDGKYDFIKLPGDASNKKFYLVNRNGIHINKIIVCVSTKPNEFDEYFDEFDNNLSQYDYFKYIFKFLYDTIGNVPNVVDYQDERGIVLMEYIGDQTVKDLIAQTNPIIKELIYCQYVDWLIRLNGITTNDSIITQRHFGITSIKKEINEFIDWIPTFMSMEDKQYLMDELEKLINGIKNIKTSLCHRDFQSRNFMIHNGNIYVIDVQDLCIGPYMHDLACLLYESNYIMDDTLRTKLMMRFHNSINFEPFDIFSKNLKLLGLLRVFKGYGRHAKYYMRDGRIQSLHQIVNSKKLLDQMKQDFQFLNIFDKYY